jgi:hypothetical protein
MANKKILLKSTSGDALFPRTSIDNLVDAVGSTVSVSVPVLDANGKLDSSYLPSYVDDIIDLKAITGTAPSTCAVGDMYFNNASGNLKIYTATATNTWGTTGTTPETGKIYVNLADSKIYRWSGSAMVEISKQVSTVASVRATSSALDTVVPTEKAVATALGGKAASSHTHSIANVSGLQDALDAKQGTLTAGTNISISNGTISNTYSYSLPTASSSTKGGVKVGTGLSIASEVLSVNTGSTTAKGILQVDETASNGVKIAVNSGTISAVAVLGTTAAVGTVRLATTTEATTGTSEAVAVTPKGLKTELDKKANTSHTHNYQAPLTAGNGIAIASNVISADITTTASNGVALAWDGSTDNAKKIKVTATAATTSARGTVILASTTEASTGTDTAKAVTCAGVKAAIDNRLSGYITYEELA